MEEKKVRVKAEEYLKGLVTTNGCGELDEDVDVIEEVIALKAVEMARQEERENAVKQLNVVLTAIIARGEDKISLADIIDQFTELINQ